MSLAQEIARRMLAQRAATKPQLVATGKAPALSPKLTPKRPALAQAAPPALINKPVAVAAKPAEQADYSKIVIINAGPRVVSGAAAHTRLREPYNQTPAVEAPEQQATRRRVEPWPSPPPARPIAPLLSVFREMSDAEARACGVLPDGELLDDWKDAERRSAPYVVPPRTEPDLAEVYRALPEVFGPGDALPPLPTLAPGFRGSCKAINPATGRQCALLAHHTKPHRHGNTEFLYAAAPNQQSFHRRDLIDQAATRSNSEAS